MPAICTICKSKNTEDAILEDKEAIFCRSISSYPTYWHASTALLLMLISRCSFIFIRCDMPQVTNKQLCFTSPTLHPPHTSLGRIWFWCGAVSQWHTLWSMWMEPLLNSQALESGRLVIACKEKKQSWDWKANISSVSNIQGHPPGRVVGLWQNIL